MSEWKGGGPERNKFSGRTLVLVRQAADRADIQTQQIEAVASHVQSLGDYMISKHITVTCTPSAERTAVVMARRFNIVPQVLPDSIVDEPEAAFLQFFTAPEASRRDTVIMVAEDGPLLYWLLRSLYLGPPEARSMSSLYCIGHASITLVNVRARAERSMEVIAIGDTGHLPVACI